MIDFPLILRIAGAGLVILALLHIPIARYLRWKEESARMSELNATVFFVHAFFVCVVLLAMGLPAMIEPGVFLAPSRAARWMTSSFAIFWLFRLIAKWTVYRQPWWKGRVFETAMHWFATCVWALLTALFAACAFRQFSGD